MRKKHCRESSARLAMAVAHKALHAIQVELETEYGFGVYSFTELAPKLVSSSDELRDLWHFRGTFAGPDGFCKTYDMFVGIREAEDALDYERLVTAELLNKDNGGTEYVVQVPKLGERGTVRVKDTSPIEVPDLDEDILAGLVDLQAQDYPGSDSGDI